MSEEQPQPSLEREISDREAAAIREGTHSLLMGYLLWLFGFTGAHRFYFGRPISGTIYFFTLGLLFIGWLVDLFLMPSLQDSAEREFVPGKYDYNVAWILLTFFGWAGAHRLYLGRWISGGLMLIVALSTTVIWPLGLIVGAFYLFDFWTLNEQLSEENRVAA